jgi:hypothetical protein
MRNLYGARSIIPNNYYFTFDKIYDSEAVAGDGHASDGILIGRCVFAKQEKTVLLKTVTGYESIAKLDNTGRFIYTEGCVMDENADINNIVNFHTFNSNGVYIIPYNKVSNEGKTGTWPHIRGIRDDVYLKDKIFLL